MSKWVIAYCDYDNIDINIAIVESNDEELVQKCAAELATGEDNIKLPDGYTYFGYADSKDSTYSYMEVPECVNMRL